MSSLASRAVMRSVGTRTTLNMRQSIFRRNTHTEAGDPHDRALPFSTSNRRALAIKTFLYLGTGFSIPFVAVWWQWNRPGGIHNPST